MSERVQVIPWIGTKCVTATSMSRKEYNDYMGYELPSDQDGSDPGYLVEYTDGGKSNHWNHKGYICWSPADVFERSYRMTVEMTFGDALFFLKQGRRVARAGWNGKGMFLFMVPGYEFAVNRPQLLSTYPAGTKVFHQAHIDMKTAQGDIVPWLCSQTDMLAEDWVLVG